MRRLPLAFLLGVGALAGFASGVQQLRCHRLAQRAAFERHVAEICVDAARSGQLPPGPAGRGPGGAPGW
ncbi:MAG: hypothetical protein ACLPJH_14075 [Myxococcaceae bacterium]